MIWQGCVIEVILVSPLRVSYRVKYLIYFQRQRKYLDKILQPEVSYGGMAGVLVCDTHLPCRART